METRHRLSALGGAGALRLWRTPVHLLPASVVDSGSGTKRNLSLDSRFRYLHLAGAGGGGRLHVHAGASVV